MPLVPAFLLMAQAASTQTVEVPILHARPSRIVKVLETLPALPVGMHANDPEGTVTLVGTASGISEIKTRINLFDVEARKVDLDLKVVSPIDHAEWKAKLTITNNRSWTGTDESTGVELKLQPRINDDGTVTVFVESKNPEFPHLSMVFRSKLNEEIVIGNADGAWRFGKDKTEPKGLQIILKYVERPKG